MGAGGHELSITNQSGVEIAIPSDDRKAFAMGSLLHAKGATIVQRCAPGVIATLPVSTAPAAEAEPPGFDSLGLDARIRQARALAVHPAAFHPFDARGPQLRHRVHGSRGSVTHLLEHVAKSGALVVAPPCPAVGTDRTRLTPSCANVRAGTAVVGQWLPGSLLLHLTTTTATLLVAT